MSFNADKLFFLLSKLSNQALLKVLETVCKPDSPNGYTMDDLSELGIPTSTLYRLLRTMSEQGLIESTGKEYHGSELAFCLAPLLNEMGPLSTTLQLLQMRHKFKAQGFSDKAIEAAVKEARRVDKDQSESELLADKFRLLSRDIFWGEIHESIALMAEQIGQSSQRIDMIIGVSSGGAVVGGILSRLLNLPFGQLLRSYPDSEKWEPKKSKLIEIPKIKDKRVLLVDDIINSGYTMKLAKSSCKKAGAKKTLSASLLVILASGESPQQLPKKCPDFGCFVSTREVTMPWDKGSN